MADPPIARSSRASRACPTPVLARRLQDGLLDLIFDRVIGEVPVPDPNPDPWQEQLKQVARGERATILAHRDIIRLSIGRIPMGPQRPALRRPRPGDPPRGRGA
jgi:hypothetical protein